VPRQGDVDGAGEVLARGGITEPLERLGEGRIDLLEHLVGGLPDRLLLGVRRRLEQLFLLAANGAVGPAEIGVDLAHGLLRVRGVELCQKVAKKLLKIVSQRSHGSRPP